MKKLMILLLIAMGSSFVIKLEAQNTPRGKNRDRESRSPSPVDMSHGPWAAIMGGERVQDKFTGNWVKPENRVGALVRASEMASHQRRPTPQKPVSPRTAAQKEAARARRLSRAKTPPKQ